MVYPEAEGDVTLEWLEVKNSSTNAIYVNGVGPSRKVVIRKAHFEKALQKVRPRPRDELRRFHEFSSKLPFASEIA